MDTTRGDAGAKNGPNSGKVARRAPDILLRSILCGALVLLAGMLGYIAGNLWLFPSLGPSIFLQVMMPRQGSSRFYNVAAGHLTGIVSGCTLAILSGAASAPSAIASGQLYPAQVVASCLAVTLMVLLQVPIRATHPPAASTALILTLGGLRVTWHDLSALLIGIAIIAVAGELVRHAMLRMEHRPGSAP